MNELLEAALSFAKRGIPVFPLHSVRDGKCTCRRECGNNAGKHPLTPHGVKDATTNSATIQDYWERWPWANIGIPTGKASGALAIDVDPRHGGETQLLKLQEQHGALPPTLTSKTGGGGVHYFFRYEANVPNSTAKVAAGIDVKSDGGYVVAPPSIHRSGKHYEWNGADHFELTAVPNWLLALIREPVQWGDGTVSGRPRAELTICEGARNAVLTSLAGSMRRVTCAGRASKPPCFKRISNVAILR